MTQPWDFDGLCEWLRERGQETGILSLTHAATAIRREVGL